MRCRNFRLLTLAAILLAALGAAPSAMAQQQQQQGPMPVTVVTLQEKDVTITSLLPGRVVASGVAEVRPQVDGLIVERLFREGGRVELGDPMYRIDPSTYEALVASAKAHVAQATARLGAARREAERLQRLQGRNVVSEKALDDAIAERDAAAAALQVAEAELLSANINLDRTTVRAPLSGIVGRSLTTKGALVTASQAEPLAVIRQLDPILVDVTQSAAELLEWRRGEVIDRLADADKTVRLRLADGREYEKTGLVTAAEPHVNETTGVVTLRLEFRNPDQVLLPGMYVQVEMPQGIAHDVVLAPQEGVSRDRRGRPIAMVVNADNQVEQRTLKVLQELGSDWIVTEGLNSGDRVIVEGLQKIAPQMPVVPEERQPAKPAAKDNAALNSQ